MKRAVTLALPLMLLLSVNGYPSTTSATTTGSGQASQTPSLNSDSLFEAPQEAPVSGTLESITGTINSWFLVCRKRNLIGKNRCCVKWEKGRCVKSVKLKELPKVEVKKKRVKTVKVEFNDLGAIVYYTWE